MTALLNVQGLHRRFRVAAAADRPAGWLQAVDDVSLTLGRGEALGLVGESGCGKSTLAGLVARLADPDRGRILFDGEDLARLPARRAAHAPWRRRIQMVFQDPGESLDPRLTAIQAVMRPLRRLNGLKGAAAETAARQALDRVHLPRSLHDRLPHQLSGGQLARVGIARAIAPGPDLLILDEPTTGVDPLSRREFWALIARIRAARPGMSLIVASAYVEEAASFDHLVAMDDGKVLATGSPAEIMNRTGSANLDEAFIALLPKERRARHRDLTVPPRDPAGRDGYVVEAENLTVRFGDFEAVKDVSFRIAKGEIFGFLGSNGCGKTTTMKALTGLVEPAEGTTRINGRTVDARNMATRKRIGYMTQSFSLYSELTVRQNLDLHARLFDMAPAEIAPRIAELAERFDLEDVLGR